MVSSLDTNLGYNKFVDTKPFTLRLPLELYRRIAGRRRRGMTAYVIEAVEEKLAREREDEVRAGFRTLAGSVDREEWDVLDKLQREAMTHVDD